MACCFIFMFFFWLFYLCRHLIRTYRDYNSYRYSSLVDSGIRAKVLFNYKTVIYKNVLLILILLLECFFHIMTGIIIQIKRLVKNRTINSTVSPFETCNKLDIRVEWITIVLNLYPVATLVPILIALLLVTFILLFSFLCTYLKWRYCGYSLDNRVVSKYVVWWCVQAALLFLCAIPYTQILLAVVCPILLLINWTLLVAESRRLSRAIRSVLYEIKHFERDDVRYRASYASYKTYRIFISIQMFALLAVVIIISISYMYPSIKLLLLTPCYFKDVYGVNIDYLSSNAKLEIRSVLNVVYIGSSFIFQVLYSVVLFTPPFILIIPWLLHALNRRIHIKNYPIRFNYAQFQPLLVS